MSEGTENKTHGPWYRWWLLLTNKHYRKLAIYKHRHPRPTQETDPE
jgi:hypothetical protein